MHSHRDFYPPPPPMHDPPPPPPPRHHNGEPMRKRSRFSSSEVKTFIPGIPQTLPKNLPREAMDALLLRARIDEITFCLNAGKLGLEDETVRRSPSPPPRYDKQGKRTNTREQRTREKLSLERQNLIGYAMKLNPTFKVHRPLVLLYFVYLIFFCSRPVTSVHKLSRRQQKSPFP